MPERSPCAKLLNQKRDTKLIIGGVIELLNWPRDGEFLGQPSENSIARTSHANFLTYLLINWC